MVQRTNAKGFTLIEVVLVLAIGGLIFLLAFLAFNQASRNRRDSQRRSDVRRMVGEAENFAGENTSNLYPCSGNSGWACSSTTWTRFINSYINAGGFKDPTTGANYTIYGYDGSITYNLSNHFRVITPLPVGNIIYASRATCVNGDLNTNTAQPTSYVGFWIVNETGQGTCADNR